MEKPQESNAKNTRKKSELAEWEQKHSSGPWKPKSCTRHPVCIVCIPQQQAQYKGAGIHSRDHGKKGSNLRKHCHSRVAWEMNLTQHAALPRDKVTLSRKRVQVNACGMLTKGSVKPLQDKARSWLTWKYQPTDPFWFCACLPLLLPLTSFQEGGSVFFRSFWDERQQRQVGFPFCKIMQVQNAYTSFKARLLSSTVLLSFPGRTASGSKTLHHHCKSKNFRHTC